MKTSYLCWLMLGVLGLQGCGKDKNLDDYKQTLLAQNLAKLQAVQGRYSGYSVAKKDGRNLGAMELTLKASTKVLDSTDQTKASAQPILVANLKFQGVTQMEATAQDSSYDPNLGTFQANIAIQQAGAPASTANCGGASAGSTPGKTYTINIAGVIRGGEIQDGTLEVVGYSDYGGKFQLTRDGASLASLASGKAVAPDTLFSDVIYDGSTHFASGENKPVKMVLLKPTTTSDQDFLNLLLPLKPVQITLNYGNGDQLPFANGNWDQVTGELTGQNTCQNSVLSLTCNNLPDNSASPDCYVTSTAAGGNVAEMHLRPGQDKDTDPPGVSGGRQPITHTYNGQGLIEGRWTNATLTAIDMDNVLDLFLPPNNRTVQISINFPKYRLISLNFPDTKWDQQRQTLNKSESVTINNQTSTQSIACQGFNFDATSNYSFSCNYLNSSKSGNVQFKFGSK